MEKQPPAYYLFGAMILGGVVGLLGAVGGTIEAIRDRMLGDPTPQKIAVADLLSNGAGSNRHVTVTDFTIGSGGMELSSLAKQESYLVVSPVGVAPGTPTKSLIVHVTEYYADGPVGDVESETFTGIYTPDENLAPEQKRLLGEQYPGLALDNIPYLEVRGYRGQNFTRAAWFAGVGVPVLVAGILGMVAVSRRMARARAGGGENSDAESHS